MRWNYRCIQPLDILKHQNKTGFRPGVNPTKFFKNKKCLELKKAPGKKRLWKILFIITHGLSNGIFEDLEINFVQFVAELCSLISAFIATQIEARQSLFWKSHFGRISWLRTKEKELLQKWTKRTVTFAEVNSGQ